MTNPVTTKLDRLDAAKQRFAQALDADVVTVNVGILSTFITPADLNSDLPTVYVSDHRGDIEIGREYIGSDKAQVVRWMRAVANQIEAQS